MQKDPIKDYGIGEELQTLLRKKGLPFFANDNISQVLRPGDLQRIRQEVKLLMEQLLRTLCIDIENDHNTKNTANRVAKMLIDELFSGRYVEEPSSTEFPNTKLLNQFYVVGPVKINSFCSHHLLPVIGHAWVGILPSENSALVGLSKIPRIVEWYARRPQIQEELVEQIADHLFDKINPDSLAVTIKADHHCMKIRGIKDPSSSMTTQSFRGSMREKTELRAEYNTMLLGHRFGDPTL